MNPIVSIVMPMYNAEAFVEEAVASVQAQSLEEWELLIVDDASTDASAERVARLAQGDARIKLIRLSENGGAGVARNAGIREARGRFIAFLDADDRWTPEKLDRQTRFMRDRGLAFSYAAYFRMSELGEPIGVVGVPERLTYSDLLKTCYIGCLTAIYDTQFFGKVYMPVIRRRQDYALWLKLLKKVEYAEGINEPLAYYRLRGDSISAKKMGTSLYTWNMYRKVERLPLLKAAYFFSHYAMRGLLRWRFPALAKRLGILHDVERLRTAQKLRDIHDK